MILLESYIVWLVLPHFGEEGSGQNEYNTHTNSGDVIGNKYASANVISKSLPMWNVFSYGQCGLKLSLKNWVTSTECVDFPNESEQGSRHRNATILTAS